MCSSFRPACLGLSFLLCTSGQGWAVFLLKSRCLPVPGFSATGALGVVPFSELDHLAFVVVGLNRLRLEVYQGCTSAPVLVSGSVATSEGSSQGGSHWKASVSFILVVLLRGRVSGLFCGDCRVLGWGPLRAAVRRLVIGELAGLPRRTAAGANAWADAAVKSGCWPCTAGYVARPCPRMPSFEAESLTVVHHLHAIRRLNDTTTRATLYSRHTTIQPRRRLEISQLSSQASHVRQSGTQFGLPPCSPKPTAPFRSHWGLAWSFHTMRGRHRAQSSVGIEHRVNGGEIKSGYAQTRLPQQNMTDPQTRPKRITSIKGPMVRCWSQ